MSVRFVRTANSETWLVVILLSIFMIISHAKGDEDAETQQKGAFGIEKLTVSHLSIHLESDNGQKIAVCTARYTKIEPTLHWEPAFRFLYVINSVKKGGSFSTVENRLYLVDPFNIRELICVATYPSVSGSVQLKKTLHLLPEARFCLGMKHDTPEKR
ncbi:uncharacterized protein isoform X4 [Danio rerio]|uniref:Uncharacterized protein isoform X4 n=1 Tax=Danio rerio TaxID=7955 RepID=A0AC58GFS6_DANRE